jgi:hypothetical protein
MAIDSIVSGIYLHTYGSAPNAASNLSLDIRLKRVLSFTLRPTLQLVVHTSNDTDGLID